MLVGLLGQETTTFDGRYYQLKDARNEPKGPQQPHPPICIGGSGEKRTLKITARYADHWNFVGGPPAEFARKRDVPFIMTTSCNPTRFRELLQSLDGQRKAA